jgi:hypothetical protein
MGANAEGRTIEAVSTGRASSFVPVRGTSGGTRELGVTRKTRTGLEIRPTLNPFETTDTQISLGF